MYYLYLGRHGSFDSPEKLIVQYQEHWFERKKMTDWEVMDENEQNTLLKGEDNKYYSIEKKEFDKILSLWGGSRLGYKNIDLNHTSNDTGYGEEYDD